MLLRTIECRLLFFLCGKQDTFESLIFLFLTPPQEGPVRFTRFLGLAGLSKPRPGGWCWDSSRRARADWPGNPMPYKMKIRSFGQLFSSNWISNWISHGYHKYRKIIITRSLLYDLSCVEHSKAMFQDVAALPQ